MFKYTSLFALGMGTNYFTRNYLYTKNYRDLYLYKLIKNTFKPKHPDQPNTPNLMKDIDPQLTPYYTYLHQEPDDDSKGKSPPFDKS